ncbi:hypothetical protein D5S17_17000 [Pseudonocardiaceae bacterium YIM PH 21723]|nr:hypothetical protein D5S17_17000 [Pseudonocardiaceae bacterium YIM PH 21723]
MTVRSLGVRMLAVAGVLGLTWAMAPMPPTRAADSALVPVFDQELYGDFTVIGNAVLDCPSHDEPGMGFPVQRCQDAERLIGSGEGARNNGHFMRWANGSDGVYDSSTARLTIPPGAHIAYAGLSWSGAIGRAGATCVDDPRTKPPGDPAGQSVLLNGVGVAAQRFTADSPGQLKDEDGVYYSAHADVTGRFAGVDGTVDVTVANVWAQQGPDCYGGWALTAVWAYDQPQPDYAPAKNQVIVYDGHAHLPVVGPRATVGNTGLRYAGGTARVGVVAYEGDWSGVGSYLLVGSSTQPSAGPFFRSVADGAVSPAHLNNLSVDARTIEVPEADMRTGTDLAFVSDQDAFLAAGAAISVPRPELALDVAAEQSAVRPGDQVTYRFTLRNPGGAVLRGLVIESDQLPGCAQRIDRLEPGATQSFACAGAAGAQTQTVTAKASGQNLLGETYQRSADVPVRVVHPGMEVRMVADAEQVTAGGTAGFTITVRNTGDSLLTGLTMDNELGTGCVNRDAGVVEPGQTVTLRCAIAAVEEGFTNTIRLTATDESGRQVSAGAEARFDVVRPKLALVFQDHAEQGAADDGVVLAWAALIAMVIVAGGAIRMSND